MPTKPSDETAPTTEEGRLQAIWIKAVRRQPMESRRQARLLTGRGLEGDANQGGKRQVTLLDADSWAQVCLELGTEVDPSLRRANLFVRGLDLRIARGRILQIGTCRLQIHGETLPCRRMDQAHPGLKAALVPACRGGVYGEVLDDGEITVGDLVHMA